MKEYQKPDAEYIEFTTEEILALPEGEGGAESNDFVEGDFS